MQVTAAFEAVERFDGRVARAATLISVLHGSDGVLARRWTGPVAVELAQGALVRLELEEALVSGGKRRRRRIHELFQVAGDERPIFDELGYHDELPTQTVPGELWVERLELEVGERVRIVGLAIAGAALGGYRDPGRAIAGIDVRVLQSEVPSDAFEDVLRLPRTDGRTSVWYRAGCALGAFLGGVRRPVVTVAYVAAVMLLLRWIGGG